MLLFSTVQAAELTPGSSSVLLPTGYMPGGSHYIVNAGDFIGAESTSAEMVTIEYAVEGEEGSETATKNVVKINAGGKAKFGFYLRYATRGVKVKYNQGVNANLTMTSGENEYTFNLDGSGEQTFLFYESLSTGTINPQVYGYNGSTTGYYYREFVEKRGEKEVFVSTDAEVLIEELAFEKEKLPAMVKCNGWTPIVNENGEYTVTTVDHNMSDEERVFMTAVVMDERASAILAKGAHRYVSIEENDMRPYNNNGTLYIPIETLANALGYYCEDNADLGYALLRSDTHEVAMIGGETTVSEGVGAAKPTPFDVFVYRNGKTLAAVRYFAELAGKTVAYDNGLVVIDNKYAVSDILNTPSYRAYAEEALREFKKITVLGKTYYVSQEDGDDYNPGTEAAPFATISKASAVAEAGDTVIVKDGVYEETLRPENNGSANAPINFIADGENVVISAADEVKEWEKTTAAVLGIADAGKDIYRAYVDWDLGATQNQVFVNDIMQTEARYPNDPGVISGDSPTLSKAWPVRGGFERVAGVDNVLKVQGADLLAGQPDNYWQGGYYVGLFGHAYHITTGKIESSTSEELTIGKERSSAWYNVPASATADGNDYNYGYIVGHKNALDADGEWIKDGDYIYLIPKRDVNMSSATVSVKKRNLVVDLKDKSFINVIGFKTIGGSVGMDNSTMCMANGLDMKYISHYIHTADGNTGYIDFKTSMEDKSYTETIGEETVKATYPRYETYVGKDGAPERGKVGNYISGTDNMFINSKVDHSAGAGVYLAGAYSYIDNNAMNDVGYAGSVVAGIIAAPKTYEGMYANVYGGHSVCNNTVENSGHSFWTVNSYKGSQMPYIPCEVAYNEFRNGMLTSADTGMTYEYFVNMGYDGVMSELHHNYIYLTTEEADKNPYSFGIYHDGSSMGVDTYQNKIFYTEQGSGYSEYAVFEQTAEWAAASHTLWNNTQIGYMPGGTSTFEAGYFTEGKPFHAGAKDGSYLENYNGIKNDENYGLSATTTSSNFEKSANVTVDENSGYADFSADGEWVKFRVNAPSGANTLGLAVRGDNHYTYDELDIYVVPTGEGMTSDNAQRYYRTVEIGAPDLDTPEMVYLHINEISGAKDIYIKATDYRSAQIGGISVFVAEGAVDDDRYAMRTYAGNFSRQGSNYTAYEMIPSFRNPAAIGTASVSSTYRNYLSYKNCYFSAAADRLIISATAGDLDSSGNNHDRSITVYVTEPGGTMSSAIASKNFVVANKEWGETDYQLVDMGNIASGYYDVYIYFPDQGSITVRDFGFLKTTADTSGLID